MLVSNRRIVLFTVVIFEWVIEKVARRGFFYRIPRALPGTIFFGAHDLKGCSDHVQSILVGFDVFACKCLRPEGRQL